MLDMLCLTGEAGWAACPRARRRQPRPASRCASRCFSASTPTPGRRCGSPTTAQRGHRWSRTSTTRARRVLTTAAIARAPRSSASLRTAVRAGRRRARRARSRRSPSRGLVTSDGFAGVRAVVARAAAAAGVVRPPSRSGRPLVGDAGRRSRRSHAKPPSRRRRGRCSRATASSSAGCSRARRTRPPGAS